MLVMRCRFDPGMESPTWHTDKVAGDDGISLYFVPHGDKEGSQAIAELAGRLSAGQVPWLTPQKAGGWILDFDAMRSIPKSDLPAWAIGKVTVEPKYEVTPIIRERRIALKVTAKEMSDRA